MAYEKQTWVDGPEGHTPLSAERLNHIEEGIEDAGDNEIFAAHRDSSVNVHGIANTALLETTAGSAAKMVAHNAATDPHGDRAYADGLEVDLTPVVAAIAAAQAFAIQRVNHTGSQTATTISDFSAAADARIALLVNAAPSTLNTLNELAAALANDPNFATTMATALAGKQPLDTDLTAIAALTSASNKMIYATGAGTWAVADLSAFARTILNDADAATMRATISLYSQAEITALFAPIQITTDKLKFTARYTQVEMLTGIGK